VLVFRVHEGRRYAIGRVTVTGVTLFPTGEVQRAAAGLRPGSPASRRAVQEAARAVRDCYGGRGYVDTSVRSSLEPAADGGTVDVRFDVREGVLARVRSIAIRGNTRTRDKVIRREIGLNPGGILDEVQAERSRRRLENLGYFETVQFFETPVPSDPGLRDLVYEVQEKSTGQFMVGAGFSSVDNLIGFGEITQANFDLLNWPYFSGGGQKARLSVEAGETRTSVDASLTEPWFLDRRLSLTVEGYRRQRNYREFDERREGGAAGLAFPFGPGKLGVRYTFERVRLLDVLQGDFAPPGEYDAIYRFTDERDDYVNGSLRVSWSYDTRNRPFLPTSGIQGSVFGEAGGDWAGGENDIYAAGATYRQWFPLWVGHYLSLRLRAESVDAYGGQDEVGVADRLYLGGGRTVRGFHYRDVGPKVVPVDEAGGRSFHPAGGLTLAAATAEYNVPVVKVLRLALFADAGNVWSDSFDADVGEYAASAGVGLRIDIPGFPIRVDYAWPLRRDDDYTPSDRWVFWIGFD
jgi:outer membrane protein insertion porin family